MGGRKGEGAKGPRSGGRHRPHAPSPPAWLGLRLECVVATLRSRPAKHETGAPQPCANRTAQAPDPTRALRSLLPRMADLVVRTAGCPCVTVTGQIGLICGLMYPGLFFRGGGGFTYCRWPFQGRGGHCSTSLPHPRATFRRDI